MGVRSGLALLSACALTALGVPACAGPEGRANVLVISLDTLRADHMDLYGYDRSTTPEITAFAREAVVFLRAYTPASTTLPAHTSLLTGLHPETHGVLHASDSLAPQIPTLATALGEVGYATAAFVNGGYLAPDFGLDRGFDVYDYASPRDSARSGGKTTRAILEWLDREPRRPFFLFAHYFDVHSDWDRLPYDSPDAYRRRFAGEEPEGFRAGDGRVFASQYLMRMNRRGIHYTDDERGYVEGLYDAGIAYTDAAVGELLDALRRRGELDRTLVVLASDHGEEFQEHGMVLHRQVFEELVRVPLILRLPGEAGRGVRGRTLRSLVELTDVAPTVLDFLGIPTPAQLQGRSLLPLLEDDAEVERLVYFRNETGSQWGVSDGRFKLVIHAPPRPPQLFDLGEDPGELRDVRGSHPEKAQELERALHAWRLQASLARQAPPRRTELDPALTETLRALGYVVDEAGSGGQAAGSAGSGGD